MTIKLFKINITDWVQSAVLNADSGMRWRDAWSKAYFLLGGKSQSNSIKACPLNGTKTLYNFGRIKGQLQQPKIATLEQAREFSENGLYAFLALEELKKQPQIRYKDLWKKVQARSCDIKGNAQNNDEGTIKVVFSLWNERLIQSP